MVKVLPVVMVLRMYGYEYSSFSSSGGLGVLPSGTEREGIAAGPVASGRERMYKCRYEGYDKVVKPYQKILYCRACLKLEMDQFTRAYHMIAHLLVVLKTE